MPRVKRGVTIKARHKKIIKMAKGYYGRSNSCFRLARRRVEKALSYAYRDRKNKKRDFRRLWIQRINAAVRSLGMKYSEFIYKLNESKIMIDRKMLADLAMNNFNEFKKLVAVSKKTVEVVEA